MVGKGRSPLAARFWNEEVESARSLDALVRTLPNDPSPLPILRSSKLSRAQQLLLLQRLVGLPCMPSYAPDLDNSAGLVLDRVLASAGGTSWWATLTGRIRAQRLFFPQRNLEEIEHVASKSAQGWSRAKRLLDRSLYALCMRVRVMLSTKTSFNISAEMDSIQSLPYQSEKCYRGRATCRHKLQRHHITAEATWNQLSLDKEAQYWVLPLACSFDLESSQKAAFIQYRVGMYHNSGVLHGYDGQGVKAVPAGALPGTHARAAVILGKKFDVWKDIGQSNRKHGKPYNLLAAQPHLTISSFFGGIVNAMLEDRHMGLKQDGVSLDSNTDSGPLQIQPDKNFPASADLFASLGFTAQLGLFQRSFLDRTKVGAHIDFGAASSFAAATVKSVLSSPKEWQKYQCPTLDVSIEQQVFGPLQARLDARFSLSRNMSQTWPGVKEITYGLDCSLESSGAAKLVVWYSPSRNEGMAEIRLLES